MKENNLVLNDEFNNLLKQKDELQNKCEELNKTINNLERSNEINLIKYRKKLIMKESSIQTNNELFNNIIKQQDEKNNVLSIKYNSLMEQYEELKASKVSVIKNDVIVIKF